MKTPERAQKPPINFPKSVLGLRSYPTVVMVIRPHLSMKKKNGLSYFKVSPEGLDEGPGVAGVVGRAPAREVEFPTRAVEHFFPIHPLLQSC